MYYTVTFKFADEIRYFSRSVEISNFLDYITPQRQKPERVSITYGMMGRVTFFHYKTSLLIWNGLASSAGISPEESGGGKKFGKFFFKTHLQARSHREACGGG
jgi:hypothetical protein